MKSLYVMGTMGSAKTTVILGLALRLRQEGLRVGFYKPNGALTNGRGGADPVAGLMVEALDLAEDPRQLTPLKVGRSYLAGQPTKGDDAVARVRDGLWRLQQNYDLVLVGGGPALYVGAGKGSDDVSLAQALGLPVLLVTRVTEDFAFDELLVYCRGLLQEGPRFLGVVFNQVPHALTAKTSGIYRSCLENLGVPVRGIIPEDYLLAAPTVAELQEVLDGEVLAAEEGLSRRVEEIVVGAMTMESALRYLRRALNKVVIMGGDRSDLALAALETSTSALVLTGGLYPEVGVVNRAGEQGVPVLLVHYDTYTAVERIQGLRHRLSATDGQTLELARASIEQHCRWREILSALAVLGQEG